MDQNALAITLILDQYSQILSLKQQLAQLEAEFNERLKEKAELTEQLPNEPK